jgi:tetratricopeptide (TPR) repeat protein
VLVEICSFLKIDLDHAAEFRDGFRLNGRPENKTTMEIHILLAGEQLGPYSEAQVRQYLDEGLVSPTDLAVYDGLEVWQSLDYVLAHLPPSNHDGQTIFPDASSPERLVSGNSTLEMEPSVTMQREPSEILESTSVSPATGPLPSLTATQKTKRKLSKIVIQPILPLEPTVPARKKVRTGKTALTLEPLRPTTSLPPITGPLPREKKAGKALIRQVQLSLRDMSDRPSAVPPATSHPAQDLAVPPASSDGPPLGPASASPSPLPEKAPTSPPGKASSRLSSNLVLYTGTGLVLVIICLVLIFIYLESGPEETSPAAVPVQPTNPASTPGPPASPSQNENPAAAPRTTASYRQAGLALQAKGDLDGAIEDYQRALNLDPRDIESLYHRGLARQAKGDAEGALADFTQVLSLDPKRADAYSNRGFVKQSQGDSDGALADYNQALLLNPKIPRAYFNEGLIEVQKGHLDSAISAYNHALDLDPKMAFAYYNRGVAKNTEGNLEGAIADYTQALVLNPGIARAYCDRGFARQFKGDSDGALADYTQALALDPKMADAFYNRALIKMQRGDWDGAVADYNEALNLDPKNGLAFYNRGLARFGKGDLKGAQADLGQFCQLLPRDAGTDAARLYLWLAATGQNDKDVADQQLSTALQNDWNSPPEDLISKIAGFLLGHSSESDLISNAASPDPSREPGQYCKVWYFAGMKRLLAGDKPGAISCFQKCVATAQKETCEYAFAQAELQALGQPSPAATPPRSTP